MTFNGNATGAAPAAAADSADVLDCGSLDVKDFETIQVSTDDFDHDKSHLLLTILLFAVVRLLGGGSGHDGARLPRPRHQLHLHLRLYKVNRKEFSSRKYSLRGHQFITFAKFLEFWIPSPLVCISSHVQDLLYLLYVL